MTTTFGSLILDDPTSWTRMGTATASSMPRTIRFGETTWAAVLFKLPQRRPRWLPQRLGPPCPLPPLWRTGNNRSVSRAALASQTIVSADVQSLADLNDTVRSSGTYAISTNANEVARCWPCPLQAVPSLPARSPTPQSNWETRPRESRWH